MRNITTISIILKKNLFINSFTAAAICSSRCLITSIARSRPFCIWRNIIETVALTFSFMDYVSA